jgi:hypothetical protein
MAAERYHFRRLILGFHRTAPDPVMRAAAEFASRLHLDLFGFFVEDTNLLDLAGLPFAREFRTTGGTWHPIDVDELAQYVALSARRAERLFNEAVRGLETAARFEVLRGSAAETIRALSRTGDIVVVIEPASPGERVSQQFLAVQRAAFRSAAAVLILPPRLARRSGPVVALAAAPDDPSIGAAAAVALALEEKLIVVQAFAEKKPAAEHDTIMGVKSRHIVIDRKNLASGTGLASVFAPLHEQLVVMTRDAFEEGLPALIASVRSIPVLVIEAEEQHDEPVGHPGPPAPS